MASEQYTWARDSALSSEGTKRFWKKGLGCQKKSRADLGSKVVAGAEAVGYKGLATFEFLRDSNGDFYFLEVNPRVQVEHTVTEMITGTDLVSMGIRVAAGEGIPLKQEDIRISGHAIQTRINAQGSEDPLALPWKTLGMSLAQRTGRKS